eukprot:5809897-Amphidinium_carterae.1
MCSSRPLLISPSRDGPVVFSRRLAPSPSSLSVHTSHTVARGFIFVDFNSRPSPKPVNVGVEFMCTGSKPEHREVKAKEALKGILQALQARHDIVHACQVHLRTAL